MRQYATNFRLPLRDGTPTMFRELLPSDKDRLQQGLKFLSEDSTYKRFFQPVSSLNSFELEYLTDVDQYSHVAWGVLSENHPKIPGLGTARFIRLKEDPTKAEFAITVIDNFQNRGLGTIFLALLFALATHQKIETLIGYVLGSNKDFLDMLRKVAEVKHESEGVYRIGIPINNGHLPEPVNGYARVFNENVRMIMEKLELSEQQDQSTT